MNFLVLLHFKDYKYLPFTKKNLKEVYPQQCFSVENNEITQIVKTSKNDKSLRKPAIFSNSKTAFASTSHIVLFT